MYDHYADIASNYEFEDFCKYLFTDLKEQDNLTWDEIRDIANYCYGVNYTTSCYKSKKARYLAKCYKDICEDKESNDSVIGENTYSDALIELAKQKVKLSEERTQINALIRRISREETLKEIAYDVAQYMATVKQLSYEQNVIESDIEKVGLLLLSDWHYGLEIRNEFNIFNPEIAIKRINELLQKVIDICIENKINQLMVVNLGDMISGNIHLPMRLNSRIDIITQVMQVSELLSEFLGELSSKFHVNYLSVVDNHSRIDPNKSDSLELESLSRITDWYLRERLKDAISFTLNSPVDIANISIYNHQLSFVHGHKDKPENLIKNLNSFCKKHIDLICSAHYHHFSTDESCDTFILSNGSLMGTDDYAYNLRLNSKPSQTLIEITPENVVSCIRKINLNS